MVTCLSASTIFHLITRWFGLSTVSVLSRWPQSFSSFIILTYVLSGNLPYASHQVNVILRFLWCTFFQHHLIFGHKFFWQVIKHYYDFYLMHSFLSMHLISQLFSWQLLTWHLLLISCIHSFFSGMFFHFLTYTIFPLYEIFCPNYLTTTCSYYTASISYISILHRKTKAHLQMFNKNHDCCQT